MNSEPPILVTGTPRSGVSMTAGIVSACGAFGGCDWQSVRKKRNAHENLAIRDFMSECFRDLSKDVRGQYPLPGAEDLLNCRMGFNEAIKYHIKESGYLDGPWFYKDIRTCLVWPFWTNAFPKAKWVIVRRHDEEIINSCMRTGYMSAFQDWYGWQWWVNQYKSRFKEIKTAKWGCVKEVWPRRFLDGEFKEVMEVMDWLGLKWNIQRVHAILGITNANAGTSIGRGSKMAQKRLYKV